MRTSKPHVAAKANPVTRAHPGDRGSLSVASRQSSIAAAAEWIIRRELLWLALLSPFMIFPDRRWVLLFAVVPALWITRFVARGRFLPRTPLDWPIALLAIMVLVSIFATFSIDYSLPKITGLLLGIAWYYALVEWADSPARLMWLIAGFLLGGAALAIVGLLGTNWLDKLEGLSDVTRGLPRVVPGLPGAESGFQPNEVAGSLVLIALPLIALTLWAWTSGMRNVGPGMPELRNAQEPDSLEQSPVVSGRWSVFRIPHSAFRIRLALTFCLLIIATTLVLTQSRGALTGTAAGTLLVLWLLVPRLRTLMAAVIGAAIIVLMLNDPLAIADKLLRPSVADLPTSDPANLRVRLDIWSSALTAIRDSPLTGIGMNTFRYIMPTRYPSAIIPQGWDVAHAHNVFLQVALDLGLPGLVAYLAMYVIAAILLVLAFRHAPTIWYRATAAGIGAGLLAYLIFGITDTVALGAKPGVFFWALLALDAALWFQVKDEQGLPVTLGITIDPSVWRRRRQFARQAAIGVAGMASQAKGSVMGGTGRAIAVSRDRWHSSIVPASVRLYPILVDVVPPSAIAVLALGLRVYRLNALSLWPDEAFTLAYARRPWDTLLNFIGPNDQQPPFYYALVKLATNLGAPELIAGRLVSVVAGSLTIIVLYLLVRRLADRWVAATAALMLAIAPLHIWYSQEAEPYALSMFLVAGSYLALVLSFGTALTGRRTTNNGDRKDSFGDTPNPRDLFAPLAANASSRTSVSIYVLATLLALYTEYSALYALLPQVILLWLFFRRKPGNIRLLAIGAGVGVLLLLPWLIHLTAMALTPPSVPQRTTNANEIGSSLLSITGLKLGGFLVGGTATPWNLWSSPFLQIGLLLALIVASILGGIALAKHSRQALAVSLALSCTIVLAGMTGLLLPGYYERTVIYALLGWVMLTGAAPFVGMPELGNVQEPGSHGLPSAFRAPSLKGALPSAFRIPLTLLGTLAMLAILLLSGWTTTVIYTSADKEHWKELADKAAQAAQIGWPILTYPTDQPVTADVLDAYKPGVLDRTHMSIARDGTLPVQVTGTNNSVADVWLASPNTDKLQKVDSRFQQAGYRLAMHDGILYNLGLYLYIRNGTEPGTAVDINGQFAGDSASAIGWDNMPQGATLVPTGEAGRQLTLINPAPGETLVSRSAPAVPGHLYILEYEARSHLTSGISRAFLICATPQNDWPVVAPNGQGQVAPNDGAWRSASIGTFCPAGTDHLHIDLRNAGQGEVDYRNVQLRDVAQHN